MNQTTAKQLKKAETMNDLMKAMADGMKKKCSCLTEESLASWGNVYHNAYARIAQERGEEIAFIETKKAVAINMFNADKQQIADLLS